MSADNLAGVCGTYCGSCPIYIAQNKGIEVQKKLASSLSSQMGKEIKVNDIQCKGCRDSAKDRASWAFRCKIRRCASSKQADSCCSCGGYPCRDFKSMSSLYGGLLEKQLGEYKAMGNDAWIKLMEERWRCSKCGAAIESSTLKCGTCNADNASHVKDTSGNSDSEKK